MPHCKSARTNLLNGIDQPGGANAGEMGKLSRQVAFAFCGNSRFVGAGVFENRVDGGHPPRDIRERHVSLAVKVLILAEIDNHLGRALVLPRKCALKRHDSAPIRYDSTLFLVIDRLAFPKTCILWICCQPETRELSGLGLDSSGVLMRAGRGRVSS